MAREGFRLTAEADHELAVWLSEYGEGSCRCHISPPCSSCTHPGNPRNQEEDDSCWEPDVPAPGVFNMGAPDEGFGI